MWQTLALAPLALQIPPIPPAIAEPLATLPIIGGLDPLVAAGAVVGGAAATSVIGKTAYQLALTPVLEASSKGETTSSDKYELGRSLGGGSYGRVFEATSGNAAEPNVVIKSCKPTFEARKFAQAELYMNKKLMSCGQGGCIAKFEGHYYNDDNCLSLVFKREGTLTLDRVMQNGEFPFNVEGAVMGRESSERGTAQKAAVIRRISKQLFENLAGVHGWSIVHRDVKGANMILSEGEKRFKLLDLGAACDLFSRTNFDSRLQVFDPKYGPPEADITKAKRGEGGLDVGAGGKFDVFSAGLVVIQMCFKAYRGDNGIVNFKKSLASQGYDLKKWRELAELRKENEEGFEILDKYGGFGLLEQCFREEPKKRISSAAAARSGFCA